MLVDSETLKDWINQDKAKCIETYGANHMLTKGFGRSILMLDELVEKTEKATIIQPSASLTEEELRQVFRNHSDCYADTWVDIGIEMKQGPVIQAITEDMFIKILGMIKYDTRDK